MTTVSQFSARIPLGSQVFAEIETNPPATGTVYRAVEPKVGDEFVIRIEKIDRLNKVLVYREISTLVPGTKEEWVYGVSLRMFLKKFHDHQVFEVGMRNGRWWENFLSILTAVRDGSATFAEAVEILCILRPFELMQERGDNAVFVHGEAPMSDRPVNFSGGAVKVETPLTLETLGR